MRSKKSEAREARGAFLFLKACIASSIIVGCGGALGGGGERTQTNEKVRKTAKVLLLLKNRVSDLVCVSE